MNTTDTQVLRNRRALLEAEARRTRILCLLLMAEVAAFSLIVIMDLLK